MTQKILFILFSIICSIIFFTNDIYAQHIDFETERVGDTESYISPETCGPSARFVIKKNKLNLVHRCKEEAFSVNGKKVKYVEIEYGEGMDCPAGCIYKVISSIVKNNREFKVVVKPTRLNNLGIGEQFRCWIDSGIIKKRVTLIYQKNEYKWKVSYNENNTDEFGNQCTVNGYALVGSKNDHSNISVSFSKVAKNCRGNDKCISAVAEAKLDTALCSTVKDQVYRNGCYLGIAVKKFDKSLCDKLTYNFQVDDFQKKRCLDNINRFQPQNKKK